MRRGRGGGGAERQTALPSKQVMSRVCQRDVQQLCGQVLSRKTRGRVWTHLGGTALPQFLPLGAHMLGAREFA